MGIIEHFFGRKNRETKVSSGMEAVYEDEARRQREAQAREEAEVAFYRKVAQARQQGCRGMGRRELEQMLQAEAEQRGTRFGWESKQTGLDGDCTVRKAQEYLETGKLNIEQDVYTSGGFSYPTHLPHAKKTTRMDSSGVRRGVQVTRNDGIDYHKPGQSTSVEVSSNGFDNQVYVSSSVRGRLRILSSGGLEEARQDAQRLVRTSVPGSSVELEEVAGKHIESVRVPKRTVRISRDRKLLGK